MDNNTPTPAAHDAAGRRAAHRQVGAAATAILVTLLLLGALHDHADANADPAAPAAATSAAPDTPVQPRSAVPTDPGASPRFGRPHDHYHDGFGPGGDGDGDGDGFGPGGGPDPGAGAPASPSPSSGATNGGSTT